MTRHVTVEGLAGFLNISSRNLSRVLMAKEGVNAQTFIRNVRMDAATAMLVASELSIMQISEAIGYLR